MNRSYRIFHRYIGLMGSIQTSVEPLISGEPASSRIPIYIYISWPTVIILHFHESKPKIFLEELDIPF